MIRPLRSVASHTCFWVLLGLSIAPLAQAQTFKFDLPSQPLADALHAVAEQTRTSVLFDSEVVDGRIAPPLHATLTASEAIRRLTADMNLTVLQPSTDTITISMPGEPHHSSDAADSTAHLAQADGNGLPDRSPWERLHVAQSGASGAGGSLSTGPNPPTALEEIVVSAQKRVERLQEVPVPVTAINTAALAETDQVRLQDYYMTVPGLTLNSGGNQNNGVPVLAIRGLSSGGGNPTVGITVDDVPYGATTALAGGGVAPDLDPSDLARIEVLRGPQGTLYGANSIGGLLKFVTVDPSTDRVSGRVQGDFSSIEYGGPTYGVRGAINLPLSDTIAVRASAFVRRNGGYVDNIETGERGTNWGNAAGGRLSGMWKPSDTFSLKLSALLQSSTVHGSSSANEDIDGFHRLLQTYLQGTGAIDRQTQVYSATANAKLGQFDLTSVTGYSLDHLSDIVDFSQSILPQTQAQFGVSGSPLFDFENTYKFTEDLRLSSSLGPKIDWLLGLFYDHENSLWRQALLAEDALTSAIVGSWATFQWQVGYVEYSAYTDFTFHITDRFNVQVGGREARLRQTYGEVDAGVFITAFDGLASPLVSVQPASHENPFTYLVTPQFKIAPNLMVYARLASGFRPGGPNQTAAVFGTPLNYKADTTKNYELGMKGDLLGRSLSIDTSLYYIDWKDIQLSAYNPVDYTTYFTNGSRAKSEGVELSLASSPLPGLTLSAWGVWDEAVLTAPFPPQSSVLAVPGERLPFTSRWSGNFSIDDDFPLGATLSGFAGAAVSYQGDRPQGFIAGEAAQQILPAYTKVDLRFGLKSDTWSASFFINNVTDKRGALSGNPIPPPQAFFFIQPRTIGVTVSQSF